MRRVAIVGTGQVAVRKKYDLGLRELGASVVEQALGETDKSLVDALYLGNMLSDELQAQKHLAALVADEAGLAGVEAIQVRAATASGAAALRVAYLAVAGGAVDLAVAVGVEKMSDQVPTAALAKALDARSEVPDGKTLLSQNALLMRSLLAEVWPAARCAGTLLGQCPPQCAAQSLCHVPRPAVYDRTGRPIAPD